MNITKKPIFDGATQGIIGFEITLSDHVPYITKKVDQLSKIANKKFDLEYEIDDLYKNPHTKPEENDELKTLNEQLKKLVSEEERLDKELNYISENPWESDLNYGNSNDCEYLFKSFNSLGYATTLVTDASFINHNPEEYGDYPPYIDISVESFNALIKINFPNTGYSSEEDYFSFVFFTEHLLYGEVKSYGVAVCSNTLQSYSRFYKFCEWVRMDAEEDFVDNDLGYWGAEQIISEIGNSFSLDNCVINPGEINFRLHSDSIINIKELSCKIDFQDDGNYLIYIKIINGNPLIEKRDTLGFIIVDRDATLSEFENEIFTDESSSKAIELFRKLNGPSDRMVKTGNILILADPENHYEEEIAQLLAAQLSIKLSLEEVENQEVNSNFFLKNYATLSHFSSIASQGAGIAGAAGEIYFSKINKLLNQIDLLYKSTYQGNSALGGEAYYLRRGALLSELDQLLKHSFLRKVFDLPQDKKIKSALRLSSKSIVHYWKKSGVSDIPGYSTHIKNASQLLKIMRITGYVGIAFSAVNSANEIYHACSLGRANECKQVTFKEIGKFTGELAGGAFAMRVCLGFLPNIFTTAGCIVTLGILSGAGGGYLGESIGNSIYEATDE